MRIKYSQILITIFLLLVALAIGIRGYGSPDSNTVNVGGNIFKVPQRNFLSYGENTGFFKGDNDVDGFLFTISSGQIKESVSRYKEFDGEYQENIHGNISLLTPNEVKRYKKPQWFIELLKKQASYKEQIIERVDSIYKVYRKVEYPYSWVILSVDPNTHRSDFQELHKYWVASCLKQRSLLTKSKERTSCKTYSLRGNLLIEFYISNQNIKFYREIKDAVEKVISNWQVTK